MARRSRSSSKGAQPQASGEEPMTYSTRFTPEQRATIDQACAILNWTPARFIRHASVSRAADVINASGPAQHRLAQLADLVVKQLLAKRGILQTKVDNFGDADVKDISDFEAVVDDGEATVTLTPIRLAPKDLADIRIWLEGAPTEFVRLIIDHFLLEDEGADRIEPSVSAHRLLSEPEGGDNE